MRHTPLQRSIINLASAFLTSEWSVASLRDAAKQALAWPPRHAPKLVKQLLAAQPAKPPVEALLRFLVANLKTAHPVRRIYIVPRAMKPPPAAMGQLDIPQLPTEAALADWLQLSPERLPWFADPSGRNRFHPDGPLRTYRYRWLAKPNGRSRLIEIPVGELKFIQRRILHGILDRVPPHDAAHGFRSGRSIVTNAAPHCGKHIVLRFDLRDFFPSVPIPRVYRIFHTIGYPDRVAKLLAGLCTTRLPRAVWEKRPHPKPDGSDHADWQRLAVRHLPQGAPTSPALANLIAYRLDVRLSKLAASLGAEYTRYADDLAFSGDEAFAKSSNRFGSLVAEIALDEGFALHFGKTRRMRRGGRQHVAGVVVNTRPNVMRSEFDVLKATLTNCTRHGPAGQNRANHADFRAHLAGRIAHIASINPSRGRKLWVLYDRITWLASPP